jgi:hypothetical protein
MGIARDNPGDKRSGDKPRVSKTRDEPTVGFYTKELGRPLQRKMLQDRLDDFSHNNIHAASHGEDTEAPMTPPRDDRAG